jgi:hypothetical protein
MKIELEQAQYAMSTANLVLEILIFGFSLWLGAYLIARNPRSPKLSLAGIGLIAYALALGTDLLAQSAASSLATANLSRLHRVLVFTPALTWSGASIDLLPEGHSWRPKLIALWARGVLPLLLLGLLTLASTSLVVDLNGNNLGPFYWLFSTLMLLPLLGSVVLIAVIWPQSKTPTARGVIILATLFFTLGIGLLLYPLQIVPRFWLLLAIGLDLLFFGWAVAVLDAFDQGETLLPDIGRSMVESALAALVFGGQVLLVIYLGPGLNLFMLGLLLVTITLSIFWQSFSDFVQLALDRVVFASFPRLREQRARLRQTTGMLPRIEPGLELDSIDEGTFARLTRRALSDYNDLPRLAANPLTRLPLIEARLENRNASVATLARAAELKTLLAESIQRLKPRGQGDFSASDEWRYYNALYFPYVAGLKPYSRRADDDSLNAAERQALHWFRAQVPERTLYNWQTAAATLVAQDLWEQNFK